MSIALQDFEEAKGKAAARKAEAEKEANLIFTTHTEGKSLEAAVDALKQNPYVDDDLKQIVSLITKEDNISQDGVSRALLNFKEAKAEAELIFKTHRDGNSLEDALKQNRHVYDDLASIISKINEEKGFNSEDNVSKALLKFKEEKEEKEKAADAAADAAKAADAAAAADAAKAADLILQTFPGDMKTLKDALKQNPYVDDDLNQIYVLINTLLQENNFSKDNISKALLEFKEKKQEKKKLSQYLQNTQIIIHL